MDINGKGFEKDKKKCSNALQKCLNLYYKLLSLISLFSLQSLFFKKKVLEVFLKICFLYLQLLPFIFHPKDRCISITYISRETNFPYFPFLEGLMLAFQEHWDSLHARLNSHYKA